MTVPWIIQQLDNDTQELLTLVQPPSRFKYWLMGGLAVSHLSSQVACRINVWVGGGIFLLTLPVSLSCFPATAPLSIAAYYLIKESKRRLFKRWATEDTWLVEYLRETDFFHCDHHDLFDYFNLKRPHIDTTVDYVTISFSPMSSSARLCLNQIILRSDLDFDPIPFPNDYHRAASLIKLAFLADHRFPQPDPEYTNFLLDWFYEVTFQFYT